MEGAGLGFFAGNAVAIAAGILFVLVPTSTRIARGLNIALFALPPIAISPILVLTFSGMTPRIVLAALGCYFVMMTATVTGLSQADPRILDLVRVYGGGRVAALRLVRLRSALPSILTGLRIAAPNAVLGSILAEFGGGGRWGLGAYLIGSLGRTEPERLWGIGLAATLIAGLAYDLFSLIATRATGAATVVTLPSTPPGPCMARMSAGADLVLSLALPFLVWWLLLAVLGTPAMIAKTPAGLFDYLFLSPASQIAQGKLLAALGSTLPLTFAGMAAGSCLRLLSGAHVSALSRDRKGFSAGCPGVPVDAARRSKSSRPRRFSSRHVRPPLGSKSHT